MKFWNFETHLTNGFEEFEKYFDSVKIYSDISHLISWKNQYKSIYPYKFFGNYLSATFFIFLCNLTTQIHLCVYLFSYFTWKTPSYNMSKTHGFIAFCMIIFILNQLRIWFNINSFILKRFVNAVIILLYFWCQLDKIAVL